MRYSILVAMSLFLTSSAIAQPKCDSGRIARPIVTLLPDGIAPGSDFDRGSLVDVQDSPICPGNTAIFGSGVESVLVLDFSPIPVLATGLAPGSDRQEFRFLVTAPPEADAFVHEALLLESGEFRAFLLGGEVIEAGETRFFSVRWPADVLTDPSGADVELSIVFGSDFCLPKGCNPTRIEAVSWEAWTLLPC